MEENRASKTARRVAMCRAAHQVLDNPRVFNDGLALRLLGLDGGLNGLSAPAENPAWLEDSHLSPVLRASLAARSQYAEDGLQAAVQEGAGQYVILGAGLDTFAYRNPYAEEVLRVFEVDHPATQVWKRSLLEKAGIAIPKTLSFVPIDFERQTLAEGLQQAGFATDKKAYFSWLGVTMYLTEEAIEATLKFVASLPTGSGIVFDYMISPALLKPMAGKVFAGLAHRVALADEPFRTFFDPDSLKAMLLAIGFRQIEDIGPTEIDGRYFQGRGDSLRVGRLARLVKAGV